jgi:hypothetical protein
VKRQIPLEQATIEQLHKFAVETVGLQDLDINLGFPRILAAVQSAWDKPAIEVDDGEEAPRPAAPIRGAAPRTREDLQRRLGMEPRLPNGAKPLQSRGAAYQADPHVILMIGKQDVPGGAEPVPVSVNGSAMLIERGQMVEIAYRYYEALLNAQRTTYTQKVNYLTHEVSMIPEVVQSYPFSVYWLPSSEEIADWVERTNTLQAPKEELEPA